MTLDPNLADAHLLVIDDEPFSRAIICRYLRELGEPETVQAGDGAEGLAALMVPDRAFVAVITDFAMKLMDGLQFLKCVRTGMAGLRRDLPVLMLTGHADHDIIGRAMALDVDAFVVKPVSKSSLGKHLARALSEPCELKPVAYYQAIVVDQEHHAERPAVPAATAAAAGMPVPLDEVVPPVVLARPILGPSRELLLGIGVPVTARLLQRLRELRALGLPIGEIYVR